LGMACLGLLASAIVWWDWLRLGHGQAPVAADPLDAGTRLATGRGRARDALAIVGGMPLLMGAISLVFVVLALVVIVRRGGHAPPMVWSGVAFFGGGTLSAVGGALDRWETFVPSSRIRVLRATVKLLAFELFGGALVAFGMVERANPDGSTPRAWAMIVF